jgi:hypothetical protein
MALTMTRTRTQTALTKMATLLANLNGELAFVRALLATEPAHRDALNIREAVLQQKREAVVAALRQFDPSLDPEEVGIAERWWVGRRAQNPKRRASSYLTSLNGISPVEPGGDKEAFYT